MNMFCSVFVLILSIFSFLPGCSSDGLSKMKDGAMEVVGLKKAEVLPVQATVKAVDLRIFAGRNLNADDRGRGMAVVFHFYRLRDPAAFMQASYETLSDPAQVKAVLAADLVETKELVVKPGEEVLRSEMLGGDAAYLGVVALFRKPSPDRWRLVFSGSDSRNVRGIVLGAHECAMTVSQGVPFNAQLVSPGSLGGVVCR